MINKIAHLADIHIRKTTNRHKEYKRVFNNLYKDLLEKNPDRIVIVGDIYHDFIDLSGEAELLMASFLNNLARIAPVRITRGNHDIRKKNLSRIDTVETITSLINNPNVIYYNKTGFYEDGDNIVWAVWNHRDIEHFNPWKELEHKRENNKTYIDLFHDPVNNCLSHNGQKMQSSGYVSVNDFKGDFAFLGDIHLNQYFGKNKQIAYPSSLIQQNFGEKPHGHGYILWDIKKGEGQHIEVDNQHVYINFELNNDIDYDNLNLSSKYIKDEPEIKIKWTDISSQINKENEIKIREYIREKYGLDKIRIEKNPIYTEITDQKILNEGIDVSNKESQRELFREYLKNNGYDDEYIKKVFEMDDIINERLEINEFEKQNIHWSIEKFWFDNFQAYGDNNIVDWNNINGIIQIVGKNQQGKTTILDAICYILYGKTPYTEKQKKHGDNRYINNKRNKDETSGGVVINVNGEKFTIYRKTERKWNKKKTKITKVKTDLEYYIGEEMTEENKLTGEGLKKTQPKIDAALGTYDDFIRIVLTNADNLNKLISSDRADFMDALIKDAGYDIFEKKLEEFKKYKKEIEKERIDINIEEEQEKIKEKQNELKEKNENVDNIKNEIKNKKEIQSSYQSQKEDKIKTLHKVDEEVKNYDVDKLSFEIEEKTKKLEENKETIKKITGELSSLVENFDYDNYNIKKEKYDSLKEQYTDIKEKISELKLEKSTCDNKIQQTDDRISNVVKDKMNDLKLKKNNNNNFISTKKQEIIDLIKERLSELKEELQSDKNRYQNIKDKQEDITGKIDELKKEIFEMEESNVCITCGRPLEGEHIEHVKDAIKKRNEKINSLNEQYNELEEERLSYKQKINNILKKSEKIKNKNFEDEPELKEKYDKAVKEVKDVKQENNIIDETITLLNNKEYDKVEDVKKSIESINNENKNLQNKVSSLKGQIEDKEKELKKIETEGKEYGEEIKKLKVDKESFEKRKDNNNQIEKLNLENKNIELTIESNQNKIDQYNSQIDKIKENEKINAEIEEVEKNISTILSEIETLNEDKEKILEEITILNGEINTIDKDIEKYREQMKREEMYKVYMQSLHRDGLPTYLLKKSVNIINQELSNILSNVDFTAFFNDNIELQMSSDIRLDVTQDALQGSGKERTFMAIALKTALRKINNNSRPNFILLDEVMGKLLEESVDEFSELLEDISNQIEKIVIIEHNHPINYNNVIEVSKDKNGVSSLKLV